MSATKVTVHEVPGRGYQKRTAILDPPTGRVRCYRAGGIRYSRPPKAGQRWHRAQALTHAELQYGLREHPTDVTGIAAECPQPGGRAKLLVREDCLQLNIWMPAEDPPAAGWPVFFYIHGGFLQWGSPNWENPAALFAETGWRAVVVAPSYRLHALGFLACAAFRAVDADIVSNVGFWDQRLALEWTAAHVGDYGGNPANITVGGLSAGAYSTFHQLAYDALRAPREQRLIRRAVMWSNGCGLPPKTEAEVRSHVDMLLRALHIPTDLDAAAQLSRLRAVSVADLVAAVERLPENAFRVVTDAAERGAFVGPQLFADLRSGELARRLKERGVQILCGEVRDEFNSYRLNSPPGSYDELVRRLTVEYPGEIAARTASLYCGGKKALPPGFASWQDLFGRIYADMQVHVSQRGLLSCLHPILPASQIFRYHIRWRPSCVDAVSPAHMGVAHGTDMSIWWFGNEWGAGLREREKETAREMVEPLGRFLWGGRDLEWGTKAIGEFRMVTEDGKRVEIRDDPRWEEGTAKWRTIIGGRDARL